MIFDSEQQKAEVLGLFGLVTVNLAAPAADLMRLAQLKQQLESGEVAAAREV